MRLEAQPGSVGAARRLVAATLAEVTDDEGIVEAAVLATSELFTNSLLHGGPRDHDGSIQLSVDTTGETVRVAVHDNNPALPVVREPEETEPSGRGMSLVATLTSAWGTTPDDTGKWVWFEIDL